MALSRRTGTRSRILLCCRVRRRGDGLEAALGPRRRFACGVFGSRKRMRGHETDFDGRNSVRRYGRDGPLRFGDEILIVFFSRFAVCLDSAGSRRTIVRTAAARSEALAVADLSTGDNSCG
jgi:hypothetical protein